MNRQALHKFYQSRIRHLYSFFKIIIGWVARGAIMVLAMAGPMLFYILRKI